MAQVVKWTPKRTKQVEDLYDLLATHKDGLTKYELGRKLGLQLPVVGARIRDLRIMLRDDTINLPCNPDPSDRLGPWVYKLTGDVEDIGDWTLGRLRDMESRIETMNSLAWTVVHQTNGSTREGKRARKIQRGVQRIVEDLEDLDELVPLP